MLELIEEHPCLVVAAIEGFCLGGGLELAISCDCRIAAQRASFGLPEVRKLSLLPSWGGLTRLPKLVGVAHTKSIALLGQRLSAEEARRIGLVNEVVPDGRALDRARAFASELRGRGEPHHRGARQAGDRARLRSAARHRAFDRRAQRPGANERGHERRGRRELVCCFTNTIMAR